tara:strand:- start:492 stop:2555 length:2064 start_codon:yes stop_codon:yes gene_type:complete
VILAHGNLLRHQTIELFKAGSDITINAEVDSFFKQISHGFQGRVVIRSINGQKLGVYERPTVWLRSPIPLTLGQTITSEVSIKPIIGLLNEVGFDGEMYAYTQGVIGRAVISSEASFFLVDTGSYREHLYNIISKQTQEFEHHGLIKALIFGVRHDISPKILEQMQYSGLSHLIAISGLHIGIMFSLGWFLGRIAGSLKPQLRYAPLVVGVLVASTYAYLAGFSIPTLRALLMCILMCLLLITRINVPLLGKWLVILVALLTVWPASVLAPSLWLSMYAVGMILLFISLRLRFSMPLISTFVLQVFIVVTMSLPIAILFGGVSFASVGYNLMVVPWFSFVVMPLTFVAAISVLLPIEQSMLWHCLDVSLSLVVNASQWAEDTWFTLSEAHLRLLAMVILLPMAAIFLSLRGVFALTLVLFIYLLPWKDKPQWQINVLDVGHGLAVVIFHGDQVLIYDTGASWQTSNYANQLIGPLLKDKGVSLVDTLVISHFDNDHAGGWQSIVNQWSPAKVITSQPRQNSIECVSGSLWQWGDIQIQALWPPQVVQRAYNPHSCVLKLTHMATKQSILLPGDIEKIAEWLLVRNPDLLDSDIIIVPHHGSNTSSLPRFVDAVSPELAIASTAYQGRWNLPSPNVVNRYLSKGSKWLDTGNSGQIVINFYPKGYQIEQLRVSKGAAWYRQMLRKGVE